MTVKIEFSKIQINESLGNKEVVFPYNGKWYKLDWDKVPSKFKQLYVLKLRLEGAEVPKLLQQFVSDSIDVSDLNIELDLNAAQEIDESYPL